MYLLTLYVLNLHDILSSWTQQYVGIDSFSSHWLPLYGQK